MSPSFVQNLRSFSNNRVPTPAGTSHETTAQGQCEKQRIFSTSRTCPKPEYLCSSRPWPPTAIYARDERLEARSSPSGKWLRRSQLYQVDYSLPSFFSSAFSLYAYLLLLSRDILLNPCLLVRDKCRCLYCEFNNRHCRYFSSDSQRWKSSDRKTPARRNRN